MTDNPIRISRPSAVVQSPIVFVMACLGTFGCGGSTGVTFNGSDSDAGGSSSGALPPPDRNTVSSLPAGDATGNLLTGRYPVVVTATNCTGNCMNVCEVGSADRETWSITQEGGTLVITGDVGRLNNARMQGGVWQSGIYDVGTYATRQITGASYDAMVRFRGTIQAVKQPGRSVLTYSIKGEGVGSAVGPDVNCAATLIVEPQNN